MYLAFSSKDRERENKGSGGGTNWCEFMSVLSRLATAESVYFSLGFMERPGALGRFVRKEVRDSVGCPSLVLIADLLLVSLHEA